MELYISYEPKAGKLKTHVCDLCSKKITAGEKYFHEKIKFEKNKIIRELCLSCKKEIKELNRKSCKGCEKKCDFHIEERCPIIMENYEKMRA